MTREAVSRLATRGRENLGAEGEQTKASRSGSVVTGGEE